MIGELIPTGYTYDSGRTAINYAFSAEASYNVFSAETYYSGTTPLETIIINSSTSPNVGYSALTDDTLIYWTLTSSTSNATVTLTGASGTLAISGMSDGYSGVLKVVQDAVGSRAMSLPVNSKVINGGGGAVSFTSNANAEDILSFTFDGSNFYWNIGYNYT